MFYNPITTKVFTYPTYLQRKNYEPFNVNAKDASTFQMDPTIAYRIDPAKACDIFVKYREGVHELENGYIRTCIYEAYRTCANRYTSDSLMSSRANFERDKRFPISLCVYPECYDKTLYASEFMISDIDNVSFGKNTDISFTVFGDDNDIEVFCAGGGFKSSDIDNNLCDFESSHSIMFPGCAERIIDINPYICTRQIKRPCASL